MTIDRLTLHAFKSAQQRCTDPNSKFYEPDVKFLYTSIEALVADIGPKPNGKQLQRKDPLGNYAPSNCHWVPIPPEQRELRIKESALRHAEQKPQQATTTADVSTEMPVTAERIAALKKHFNRNRIVGTMSLPDGLDSAEVIWD